MCCGLVRGEAEVPVAEGVAAGWGGRGSEEGAKGEQGEGGQAEADVSVAWHRGCGVQCVGGGGDAGVSWISWTRPMAYSGPWMGAVMRRHRSWTPMVGGNGASRVNGSPMVSPGGRGITASGFLLQSVRISSSPCAVCLGY